MIIMSKSEVEQTGRMMDEQQLVIRDLLLIAKSYLDSIDFEIQTAMDRGNTEAVEDLTESTYLIKETIDRAENGPAWEEKIAAVEHGREMSEILKECNYE